jgi:hypothetical protein
VPTSTRFTGLLEECRIRNHLSRDPGGVGRSWWGCSYGTVFPCPEYCIWVNGDDLRCRTQSHGEVRCLRSLRQPALVIDSFDDLYLGVSRGGPLSRHLAPIDALGFSANNPLIGVGVSRTTGAEEKGADLTKCNGIAEPSKFFGRGEKVGMQNRS